ncbi:hypothetical protein [Methylobacterium sp. WL116]|uniref:hypothetical protein n=1 Tax=Methylobacterium sp. WL116 TaxID=2603889 RepID=UPI00164F8A2A|nr:hypothetical protein [Methylobacterium sp. WL116]
MLDDRLSLYIDLEIEELTLRKAGVPLPCAPFSLAKFILVEPLLRRVRWLEPSRAPARF